LIATCGNDLHGLRDRALLLVAYDSMRRRSELISLRVEDIEWLADDGATILLRKSKTDQHGCGKWIHLSAETTHALHQWLSTTKINEGLIFRGVRSSGAITDGLCESRISRIYKALARKAGLSETLVQCISGLYARRRCTRPTKYRCKFAANHGQRRVGKNRYSDEIC